MIDWLEKFAPWASDLPMAAKLSLSLAVVAGAAMILAMIWSPPPPNAATVSVDQIQEIRFRLVEIQGNWDARWTEVEPLAERTQALISEQFPDEAKAIEDAQRTYASVTDVARVLRTQLDIVIDGIKG